MDGENRGSWPPPRQERATARVVLALITAYVVIAALVVPALAQSPSPTPTGSPTSPAGPTIALLNPSIVGEGDPPQISDNNDGVDTLYHVVAWVNQLPPNALIEAYVTPTVAGVPVLSEITAGTLSPVPESPDTFELFWDVPADVPEGDADFTVRLFTQGPQGFEEVASDTIPVRMEHQGNAEPPSTSRAGTETVELTWPTQNGFLGFHKPRGGSWRSYVDFMAINSRSTSMWYTTTAPGSTPEWTQCGNAPNRNDTGATCTLVGRDTPSQVTAFAALAHEFQGQQVGQQIPESTDAHRVRAYAVDPAEMEVSIFTFASASGTPRTDTPRRSRQIAGNNRPAGDEFCIGYRVVVSEQQFDRPIPGANIDVHVTGPTDQVQFGSYDFGFFLFGEESSNKKKPDKAAHSSEPGRNCDPEDQEPDLPRTEGEQGDHNLPGQGDIKHRESVAGSGLDGGTGSGRGGYVFAIYSPTVGFTDITAWVDDEPLLIESEQRPADTDIFEADEASMQVRAQWLPQTETITVDPLGGTAPAGACAPYTVKVRAGTNAVPGINIDVHAVGPDDDLDFCTPTGGAPRRAPALPPDDSANKHSAEDEGEAIHPVADGADTQHTEGETDAEGNFVFGILSPAVGDTTLTAWIDGEAKGQFGGSADSDNDELGSSELRVQFTHSWASSVGDAEVRFVNPSAYGDGAGDTVSNAPDAGSSFHVVARVDAPALIQGVEFLLSSDGTTFAKIGDGQRVGFTDTYEFGWSATVEDGDYTLRARIVGTNQVDDREITVDNGLQTAEITSPLDAALASFTNRAIQVSGVASADAEGVNLYYTKTAAKDDRESGTWIFCGRVDLPTADGPQEFDGPCSLEGADQPSQVTGLAAIAFTCDPVVGCEDPVVGENLRTEETGDAHRVFGLDANAILSIEPAEIQNNIDICQKMTLTLQDQTGQPIGGLNVDVHVTGPADAVDLCDPDDGSASPRRPPDQGGHTDGVDADGSLHTEAETLPNGRFIFGVTSDGEGDTFIEGWIDENDDDVKDGDEKADNSVLHWSVPGGCDILGTEADETLTGTSANERICGLGGDDVIKGKGGRDVLIGGPGDDELFGGKAGDKLRGRGGNDLLKGQGGNDNLKGGRGRDTLRGGRGDDRCEGGPQKDRVSGCESGPPNRRFF